MKKLTVVLLVMLVAFGMMMVSCTKKAAAPATAAATTTTAPAATTAATTTPAAAPAEEKKAEPKKLDLTIYSAASQSEAEKVAEAFNKVHPEVTVTIIQAGSGDIVTRIKTEYPKPEGDVVLLLASENLDQVYDMLAEYKSANDAEIDETLKDSKSATPKYYGTSMPLQAIMYNTDLLSEADAPKSWKDLADPKYKGQVVLANPASSGSAYAQLYMMNYLYGMDFVAEVAKNATYLASSTAGPESVARGEYAISVTGEMNIANAIAAGNPIAYVLPEEGTGRRIEGSAILANCKNLEAAQLFIDFITSKEGLTAIVGCNRRAVSAEVAAPDNLPSLADMKFFPYDAVDAKSQKKALVAEFQGLL